ncbi:MAG: phenylalanine--tRNA ligase subunit beta [Candidatus Kerfeldbacteria bacterium]|nr:phenylalanine--tRNA ligase subunit beta [Candidatus Kerfeldbacteria bacterium]
MKLSLNWLKQYIDLPEDPTALARLITMHIAEVERVTVLGQGLNQVVVGEVLSARDHPNANNLHIGMFDVGETEPRQIIFGGKAVLKPGDKLPIALPGAQVHGLTISERTLRGEVSRGMCCLNSELGILDQAERVEFLPTSVKNGTLIRVALQLDDVVIEIDNKTLTHRADLFSHVQFARELSVVLRRPLRLPALLEYEGATIKPLQVTIADASLCQRYCAAVLEVKLGPSPDWLQRCLQAVGVRPINVIVDITNYVMLDIGGPLHAFDYAKLSGQTITVRSAKAGETITTLDQKQRQLTSAMLVIADATNPVAVAGIMGGQATEVTDTTTTIMLEAALFDPISVRLTSRQLGLRSEASTRFEKAVGYTTVLDGFWRAIGLLHELAGAKIVSPLFDLPGSEFVHRQIDLKHSLLERMLGITVPAPDIERILTGLGFALQPTTTGYTVTVPLWRTDITAEHDIVEEVARMYGYDAFPLQPLQGVLQLPIIEPTLLLGQRLIHWLVASGAKEVMHYSFYSDAAAQARGLDPATHHTIVNPMNPNQHCLRQTLLVNLWQTAQMNQRQQAGSFVLAEYGHVYLPSSEQAQVGGLVVDSVNHFRRAKGLVEWLLHKLNVVARQQSTAQGIDYYIDHDMVAQVTAVETDMTYVVFHLATLASRWHSNTQYQAIPQYPNITLDISLQVPTTVSWAQLKQAIVEVGRPLVQSVELFDLYNNEIFGIRFVLQAPDRTLTMAEAEMVRSAIIDQLVKQFQVTHRY